MKKRIDKIKKYNIKEVYPNSPLIEVVCEMRFPGDLEIECGRSKFHKKVKKTYPKILVPQSKDGQAISLAPYRFVKEDKSAGVNLAINSFGYYEKKYQGHTKFIKEFLRLSKILGKALECAPLTGALLR